MWNQPVTLVILCLPTRREKKLREVEKSLAELLKAREQEKQARKIEEAR